MTKYYLNLTNGIEFLDIPEFKNKDFNFVRIQSTSCEQHNWNKLLMELDYSFLLDLALGNHVVICDTSAHKKISRALYQGVEFIRFVLSKYWLGIELKSVVKGQNCYNYFKEEYKKINEKTFKKLKYLKKFLNTDSINITTIGKNTTHDSDYKYYKEILIKHLTK